MGQKSKNAGKKQSKTCNKLANAKSVRIDGCSRRKKHLVDSLIYTNPEDGTRTRVITFGEKTRFNNFVINY